MDGPRVPPRFVPTLTTVVALKDPSAPPSSPSPAAAPAPAAPGRTMPTAWESPDLLAFPPATPAWSPAAAPLAPPPTPTAVPSAVAAFISPASLLTRADGSDGIGSPQGRVQRVNMPFAPFSGANATPRHDFPQGAQADHVALSPRAEADAFRLEEDLLHRVLQRVDASLEERMTDAVSAAVQQQLDAMIPRLRAEVERVLRQLVVESMARELSETPGSASGSVHKNLE